MMRIVQKKRTTSALFSPLQVLLSERMKPILVIAGFFIALSANIFELILGNIQNDATDLSAIKIIEKYGYPAESHITETEDGYFLQLHRIPHGKNSTNTSSKEPLLFIHGVLTSSNGFLMLGLKSLPFIAADRGYDVWLANLRGNHYAKLHRTLSSKSPEFWNFSFHEVGFYDLPALIDYICNYTQRNKVTIMSNSFGTTTLLVMATTRPEYQKKIRAAVLIAAPTVFIRHKKLFQLIAGSYPLLYSKSFTNREVHGDTLIRKNFRVILGILGEEDTPVSRNLSLSDEKTGIQDFFEDVWFFFRFYPSSSSMKVFTHYLEMALSGKFRQYDYGPDENLIKYKSSEPPEYNLETITIPVSLIYAVDDLLAGEEDERYLVKQLKNVKSVLKVNDKMFRHIEFLIGKNAKELVYDKVMDLMENL